MGRLMIQNEAQGLGGALEHLLFLKISGDLVLATGRSLGTELVDLNTKRVTRIIGEGKPADALCALPSDGMSDTLLVGGPDGVIRQYEPQTGALRRQQQIGDGAIRDLAVAERSAGMVVAVASEGGVRLWATEGRDTEPVKFMPRPQRARPFRICFSGDDRARYLVCAFTDGWLAAWNLDAVDQEPNWRQAHSGPIWTLIDLDDDDRREPLVASGGSDRSLCVWGIADDGALVARQKFQGDGTIRRLGHAVDGEREGKVPMLASASATGAVSLWRYDGPADRPLMEAARHRGEVYSIACTSTAEGVIVASGDFNGDIEVSRLSSSVLKSMRTFFRTDGPISAVTGGTAATGPFLACAGATGQIRVIDPETGAQLQSFSHGRAVRALAAGGTHLLSSGLDHRVLDWDPDTGQLRSELPMGHDAEVHALATATHRDVLYALSGGLDGTVQRCPLDDPEASTELASGCGQVTGLAVVPGPEAGTILVVIGSTQGLLRVSMDEPGEVRSIAPYSVQAVCLVFDGSQPKVVAARTDGSVDMYDPVRLTQVAAYGAPFPARPVRALASHLSERGDSLVLGGCDEGYLLKWHVDGRLVGTPSRSGRSAIRALHVTEAAKQGRPVLLTGGDDASMREWLISPDQPLVSGGSFGSPIRVASILLQDQPADADLLAREALTRTIVDAFAADGTAAPVVVGIHAPWGQGKSSLLRQIQARLDPERPQASNGTGREPPYELRTRDGGKVDRGRITSGWAWKRLQQRIHEDQLPYQMVPVDGVRKAITVWFNPWMYENPDQVWAGLTQEITQSVMARLPEGQRRRLFFDLNLKRTGPEAMRRQILASARPRSIRGLAAVAVVALATITTIVGAVAALVNNNKLGDIVGVATATFLVALAVVGRVIYSSMKGFPTWFDPAAVTRSSSAGILSREPGADTADPLDAGGRGYLYLLQHDVRELVDLATEHASFYIFVDDLDRCSPAIVADTIEAVNLFLTKAFGPCNFVLALDPATVAAHLETAHPSIQERAMDDPVSFGHLRHTGWRFMEKIVDLPIRLPRIPDAAISNYLNELLNAGSAGLGAFPVAAETAAEPNGGPPAAARSGSQPEAAGPAELAGLSRIQPWPPSAPAGAASGGLDGVTLTGRMEDVPLVRDALTNAVLNLPGRNPRQTKAFINLWRFYMVLDYELGYMTNSITATRVHSAEMARLVEIMVRWPWLLDALGARRPVGSDAKTVLADLMRASGDDEEWERVTISAHMDVFDESTVGLRELLQRRGGEPDTLIAIASRYL
jgi:WD40 repeat protein